jgi:signal transduction histidine kinase/CheY-like chemotaxis protein
LKNRSIVKSIILPLLIVLIVGIALQTFIVAKMSFDSSSDMSLRMAEDATQRYVSQFDEVGLESYMIATTLAPALEELAKQKDGREKAVRLIEGELSASTNILGIWACYEPDAFDGKDAAHINAAPFENSTGRFVPYIYRASADGDTVATALADFDDPQRGEYYSGVRDSGKPYITDPFVFEIDGKKQMFCTVAIPIFRDDVFVGAVGVDLSLDELGSMLEGASILNDGDFFALTGDGEFIVPPGKITLMSNYNDTWMKSLAPQIRGMLEYGETLQQRSVNSDTDEEIIFTASVVNFARGDDQWIVGSIIPMSDVRHSATQLTLWILFIGIMAILIVSAFVFIIVRRNLGELPLISDAAEKLAVGDINVHVQDVPADETRNEIGRLKQSFERLIRATQAQVSDVQRVAGGDYKFAIKPQSDKDLLNISLDIMVKNLNGMYTGLNEARSIAEVERTKAEKANASKDIFLAQMSHEMRTPLNTVIGLSELLLESDNPEKDELSSAVRADVEKIYESGVSLLGLINDILDLSKTGADELKLTDTEYDIPSIINDTMTMNALHIGSKPIDFRLNVDSSLPSRLTGDALRVKQIWNNVLDNAFKFTASGYVDFRVTWSPTEEKDIIWLEVEARDTGIGIRPDEIGLIFTDTESVATDKKTKYRGSGIGLPLAKKLSELMGGDITAESVYEEGSTFKVKVRQRLASSLPIGEEVADNLMRFKYAESKRLRNEKLLRLDLSYARVLVVDDVPTNLEIARGLLRQYDLEIDTVLSGREAIELIRSEEPRYNAVFMDHMMPDLDGIETVKVIRNEIGSDYARDIPILALTANAIFGNEQLFLNNGFQAFLSKPINIIELDTALRMWVRDKDQEPDTFSAGALSASGDTVQPESRTEVSVPEEVDTGTGEGAGTKTDTEAGTENDIPAKPAANCPDPELLSELLKSCMLFNTDGMNHALDDLESYEYESGGDLVKWLRAQADAMGFRVIADRLRKELE